MGICFLEGRERLTATNISKNENGYIVSILSNENPKLSYIDDISIVYSK